MTAATTGAKADESADIDPDNLGPEGAVDTGTEPDDDDEPTGADQLEDAGKRALDAMKTKWRTERDLRKQAVQGTACPRPTSKLAAQGKHAEIDPAKRAD
jgi:hypothetical protein